MNRPLHHGFTLIETMVVISIVAILALMLVPTYQDKAVRDQINEALPLADLAKGPVAATWSAGQPFPADNAAAGLPAADYIVNNFVKSVAVQDGAVHVTFGNRASSALRDKVLSLRVAVVESAPVVPPVWVCGYAQAPTNMAIKGENRTTVAANFLPLKCRT
ncbi:MAG: pilin [Betaproteobacteria bacterium]